MAYIQELHRPRLNRTRTTSELELRAMAVEFPQVQGHPNRLPFEGVLTLVDVPSDKVASQYVAVKFGAPVVKGANYAHYQVLVDR